MRNTFTKTLLTLARKDKKIILLTGDLGFSVFEEYIQSLPRQYLNMGVSEQNMAGVAAGLAMEGKKPIIYSIIPFTTMRNFEQIRNDICYQNLNVKIVGVGAGFSYGTYGHTHHGLEDFGVLRTLPNIVLLGPGDPIETRLATLAMIRHGGPVYMRLGKAGEPELYKKDPAFKIGKGIILRGGRDVAIVASSTLVYRATEVAKKLEFDGISALVVSMHTIKPLDVPLIMRCIKKYKALVTLEEHSINGGLGSAVAEVVAESGKAIPFRRIGVPDRFTKVMGRQEYMRHANGLDVDQIASVIRKILHN